MNLLVLLLLALPVLSSASLHDTENDLNGSPKVTVETSLKDLTILHSFRQKKLVPPSYSVIGEREIFLEWVTFDGHIPSDAVSISNDYVVRADFVCKYGCATGFYSPATGPYCYYPIGGKELKATSFELLVNKNNFEVLTWKRDSSGSVPKNSVCSCPGNICVGKNDYGLGKVDIPNKAFFLPWHGSEHWYKKYDVLTTSDDITSQRFHNVQYNIKEGKISLSSTEVMVQSSIKNYDCNPVKKTDTLSKTYQVEKKWETTSSVTFGVKTSMTAGIPEVVGTSIEIDIDTTFEFTQGTTLTVSVTETAVVEVIVPPNHSCKVSMIGRKANLNMPFTAHLSRTYGSGENTELLMTGMYNGIQVVDIEVVQGRCEILDDANPCP